MRLSENSAGIRLRCGNHPQNRRRSPVRGFLLKTYKKTQRKERSRQRPATGLTEVFPEQGVTWADRALDIRPASPCDHPGTALWQKDGLDARYTYGIERTRQELAGLMEGVAGFNLRELCGTPALPFVRRCRKKPRNAFEKLAPMRNSAYRDCWRVFAPQTWRLMKRSGL